VTGVESVERADPSPEVNVVALVVSLLLLGAMCVPFHWYAKRRPVGSPVTWGEAMVAATYVFFVLFWAYGVVPHQWLLWADSELAWRPDIIWFGPGSEATIPFTGWVLTTEWIPMSISAQAIRDIIATLIYVVLLGIQIWYWSWWQNRGKRAEAATAVQPVTPYGRPLIKRA